ncbi:MAG: MerR family transcriptional regulator [Magnetococcales bacterium]|nr:MerR family transcriptional regulator [Magnetococcales bacterium]
MFGKLRPDAVDEMVKIGVVAKRLDISIRTIHMYEREGLFISHKNRAGTRYFSERDIDWLIEIRRMIKSSISIAGIRTLLSLIPCWEKIKCGYIEKQDCPAITEHFSPCWANKGNKCGTTSQECRNCEVYEMRFCVGVLKSAVDIKLKQVHGFSVLPAPTPSSQAGL